MGSRVLTKHDPNHHRQTIDISPVIVVFGVGLLRGAENSGPNTAGMPFGVIRVNDFVFEFLNGQGL